MIIFTKRHRPLTAKLMFQLMLISLVVLIVVPNALEVLNYRLALFNPIVSSYISAACVVLGILGYIIAIIGLVCSLIEGK